jgi:hypothetical protein
MKNRKNVTWEYRNMNTRDLLIDDLYQRDIDPKRLMRMVKNFDPCLVNTVKVSYRDGKYYVFDGQHTISLLKTIYAKGNDTTVECKVFSGLTRLDEMELFVAQNGESSVVSTLAKYRALYNFGDKDVCGMVKGAAEAGVKVDFKHGCAAFKCVAVRTLLKAYLSMPYAQYVEMLRTLGKAWDGIAESFSAEMVNGMSLFYKTYGGRFTSANMVKSLKRVLPVQIVREGKSAGATRSSSAIYARIILRTYNNNRTTNRLPDEL